MVDSSSFLVCLVLLVARRNPSCSLCPLVCAKEGNEMEKKVGSLDSQGMSDRGNRDFVKSRNLKP